MLSACPSRSPAASATAASVSTSGEHPKFRRAKPRPESPNDGPSSSCGCCTRMFAFPSAAIELPHLPARNRRLRAAGGMGAGALRRRVRRVPVVGPGLHPGRRHPLHRSFTPQRPHVRGHRVPEMGVDQRHRGRRDPHRPPRRPRPPVAADVRRHPHRQLGKIQASLRSLRIGFQRQKPVSPASAFLFLTFYCSGCFKSLYFLKSYCFFNPSYIDNNINCLYMLFCDVLK